MFGLTSEEVKASLRLILGDKAEQVEAHYKIMEGLFNGYCFTNEEEDGREDEGQDVMHRIQKVFNTNTCLEYFVVRITAINLFDYYLFFLFRI